jgi:NTE family protein
MSVHGEIDHPHVTLVLGAGGPIGRAFHAGVLGALAEACGWDARSADLIVGTSAGAQIGALLRAGWDAHQLLRHMQHPNGASPHIGENIRRLLHGHWPRRPLWIPAVHAETGARVVFGRDEAPLVDVGTAVRCSSAVPIIRPAVEVGSESFVDGGVASPTHADLAAEAKPNGRRRVVVVLSPLSRYWPLRLLLRWELRSVVRHGVDVVLFEPDREVAAAMGWNPMNGARAAGVAEAAFVATQRRLQRRNSAGALCRLVGA